MTRLKANPSPRRNALVRAWFSTNLRTGDPLHALRAAIFALDLVKNGKVRVWAYSAGFLDSAYEARDEDQAEEIDAPSEPLKSIDRRGPRKDAQNALRKSGA